MLVRDRLESKPNAADASAADIKQAPRERGFLIASANPFRRRRPNCAPGTFGTPGRRTGTSMCSSEAAARRVSARRRERTSVRDHLESKPNTADASAAGIKKAPRERGFLIASANPFRRRRPNCAPGTFGTPDRRTAGPLHPCSRAKGEQGIFYVEAVSVRQYAIVSSRNPTPQMRAQQA